MDIKNVMKLHVQVDKYPLQDIKDSIMNSTLSTTYCKTSDAIKALQYDLNIDYNAKLTVTGIDDTATKLH